MSDSLPLWERERRWPLMRPFVYHLLENFVYPEWIPGRRIVDFSAGLGDLSRYLHRQGATSVLATAPEAELHTGAGSDGITWQSGVDASRIAEALGPESVDLFCARMVLQFPRYEDAGVDVDSMLDQIHRVLTPGGRVVIASHAFFSMQNYPSLADEQDADALISELRNVATQAPDGIDRILGEEAARLAGLAELVQYLGLPPRESSAGTTGFGLRVPLLVDSFLRSGFELEIVDDIEPFTFPLNTWERFDEDAASVAELGRQVFDTKRRYLLDDANRNPYTRPSHHARMLAELGTSMSFVWVPIVRVVARKPD